MTKNQQRFEELAGLILIAAVLVGCGFVLRPFLLAILWAVILCVATWPLYNFILKRVRGRRGLAAAVMTLIILLILVIPFVLVGMTFADDVGRAIGWLKLHGQSGMPPPPAWVQKIPLAGSAVSNYWSRLAADTSPIINKFWPYLQQTGLWLLQHSLAVAGGVLQMIISVLLAFFIYRDSENLVSSLRTVLHRISGGNSDRLIGIVYSTLQGVVYGILGTALVQGILAGIGLAIAGVPSPVLFGLLTFFLSLVPIGPPIVWVGAAIYLFATSHPAWGVFMLVYGFFIISGIDNVIKPYLISRGAKLPFIIMLLGAIGGIIAFGFIGAFLGPTLLALAYSFLEDFMLVEREKIGTGTNH
jgi:predicted PurR-regulated permease PerM